MKRVYVRSVGRIKKAIIVMANFGAGRVRSISPLSHARMLPASSRRPATEVPCPGRSGAMTRCVVANSGITRIHILANSPGPCNKTSGGPAPPSSTVVDTPASCRRRSATGSPASNRARWRLPVCVPESCSNRSDVFPVARMFDRCVHVNEGRAGGSDRTSGGPPIFAGLTKWGFPVRALERHVPYPWRRTIAARSRAASRKSKTKGEPNAPPRVQRALAGLLWLKGAGKQHERPSPTL
jgi:hypothetical protein